MKCTLVVFLVFYIQKTFGTELSIAGFFHTENTEEELAFRFAIDRINHDFNDLILNPSIEHVSTFDSYNTSRRVCDLVKGGIGGILGPQSPEAAGIIESMSSAMDIPLVKTFWDISSMPAGSAVNVFPDPAMLAKALVAVIRDMDWSSYAIIYESDNALIRLHELLKSHKRSFTSEGHVPFTVWQLDPDGDNRPLLKEIEHSSETHIILDCSRERILDILAQAKEVNMLGEYHSYVLTSLDAHTLDYGDLKQGSTNITTLRLIDSQRHMVQAAVQDWVFLEEQRTGRHLQLTPETLLTEAALMYDAVNVYAKAVQEAGSEIYGMPLNCTAESKWEFGARISQLMKESEIEGMTGKIKFDPETGRRTFFTVEITELTKNGFRKIGSWDPENLITYTRTKSEMESEMYQSISNKTFIVVSRIGAPYLTKEADGSFRGYSIDLIDEIAKDLNFKYKFVLATDNQYGSFNKDTKQWNGLIRELRDRRADLAICDLTITFERRSAVDFTMPFMTLESAVVENPGTIDSDTSALKLGDVKMNCNLEMAAEVSNLNNKQGISILYARPTKQPPDLFSFLLPFSINVWIYMATAYLGVSLLLYLLARCAPDDWENPHPCDPEPTELECTWSLHNCLWFSIGSLMAQGCDLLPKISPYEWKNPHPCNPNPDELENTLALYNAIWHNIGSLMQQGSDIAPQALSTRIVAGMWWFFVLIMISSYTANLAAFLTMDRMDATIESCEDLASQTKVKYGVMKGGSSANFFRDSNVSLYQKMWSAMESARPSVFASNNDEGVDRVLRGKRQYAFFMESTSIEYQKEKHCELQQVGGLLDSKGYGIAMPFNSPYRIAISGSVLKMQESGKLAELKDRWWKNQESSCDDDKEEEKDSAELGIANVGGVFLVLIVGCATAFFVSILEFLWNVRKVAKVEKISPKEAFLLELKFALQCYGTTKPVRKAKSESTEGEPQDAIEDEVDEGDGESDDRVGRGLFADDPNLDSVYLHMNGIHKSSRAQSYT